MNSSKTLPLLYFDRNPIATFLNNNSAHDLSPQIIRETPRLPIPLPGNVPPGCRDGFQSVISRPEGVLGDMRSRHRLACGTRSKTGRVIFFRFAGGGMSGKRSAADLGHPEHARTGPPPACFDGIARSVVLRIRLLKKRKHPFGAVRSPGRHRALVFSAVFFHKQCVSTSPILFLICHHAGTGVPQHPAPRPPIFRFSDRNVHEPPGTSSIEVSF